MNNARLLPVMVLTACCVFSAHAMMNMEEGERPKPTTIQYLLAPGLEKEDECKKRAETFLADKKRKLNDEESLRDTLQTLKRDLKEKNHLVTARPYSSLCLIGSILSVVTFSVLSADDAIRHSLGLVPKVAVGVFGLLTWVLQQ